MYPRGVQEIIDNRLNVLLLDNKGHEVAEMFNMYVCIIMFMYVYILVLKGYLYRKFVPIR